MDKKEDKKIDLTKTLVKIKESKKNSPKTTNHPNLFPRTFGERAADRLTKIAGSWGFIIGFILVMVIWIIANGSWVFFGETWDPYPFILLNLALSCLAAIQAPVILMSQNREAQKDRQRSEYDYAVNRKSAREIEAIQEQLNRIEKRLIK